MPFHVCPTCNKKFSYKSVESCKHFPFCSKRCKMVDLAAWFDGKYIVPGSDEEDSTDRRQEETG
ncbi:MAG: DNA gyrase inhibitor YacG [Planctomycetes bacterium]|nr:DNA gyrase inhibitor YacG [Planctomycetota bacterium]